MESQFSEILTSRNLLIALEPIGLSELRKKYGITHVPSNGKRYFTDSEELHFSLSQSECFNQTVLSLTHWQI